jgi:hypothetical protein
MNAAHLFRHGRLRPFQQALKTRPEFLQKKNLLAEIKDELSLQREKIAGFRKISTISG